MHFALDQNADAESNRTRARAAFHIYVARCLGALSGVAAFGDERGQPLLVDGFRLRTRFDASVIESTGFTETGAARGDAVEAVEIQIAALAGVAPAEIAPGVEAVGAWSLGVGPRPARGSFEPVPPSEDFVFSYLAPTGAEPADAPPRLVELRRGPRGAAASHPSSPLTGPAAVRDAGREYFGPLVEVLMDTVELLVGDEPVVPKYLVIRGDRIPLTTRPLEQPFDLGPRTEERGSPRQPLHSVAATEPAITTLARHWGLLRRWLRLDRPGAAIDGFRLRSAGDWVVPSSGHPAEMYEYLARVCNVTCEFCYLFGNPSSMAIARGRKVISDRELETRMRYFSSAGRRALFHAQWELNEFLVDPKAATLLPALRERSDESFLFITNGSPLTEQVTDMLAEVRPVHVIVSVNSIEPEERGSVMNESGHQTSTALGSLRRLSEREIPFAISLAAFPDFSTDSLERTVEAVRPLAPTMVRVNLPGFTREQPYQREFDTEEQWRSVVEWLRDYRGRCDVPIVVIPSAFEAARFEADVNVPRVLGVVRNSPGAAAGLRPGDVVRRVGFFEVEGRAQLRTLLLLGKGRLTLTAERGDDELELEIDTSFEGGYPYTGHLFGKYTMPWGIVCAPSLGDNDIQQIRHRVEASKADRVWIVTSELMERSARALIDAELPDLAGRIELVPAGNEFLGGNIRILDMGTVGDIGRAVRARLRRWPPPGLLLVPGSGFNQHGRDLSGRHWGDLSRCLGIPVALLDVGQFRF